MRYSLPNANLGGGGLVITRGAAPQYPLFLNNEIWHFTLRSQISTHPWMLGEGFRGTVPDSGLVSDWMLPCSACTPRCLSPARSLEVTIVLRLLHLHSTANRRVFSKLSLEDDQSARPTYIALQRLIHPSEVHYSTPFCDSSALGAPDQPPCLLARSWLVPCSSKHLGIALSTKLKCSSSIEIHVSSWTYA
ncbi:hypothetical protein BP00DRAFT_64966 [Aspergillus indologenus CBS 114.80]|uniref:Uncharacterized protein n=1 Tax=Aspergillus indologenus CBS 114.80 TaxID=1450541 RepID=A0A2V5J8E0_9EURO|nr:hypothetical protein BP00DRAFT_64966 [Aspergillus indologenus CBS 114.80]